MPRLSNFFRPRDPEPDDPAQIVCRPVERREIEPALRLILANDQGLAGDDAVLEFLAFAVQRQIDLNLTWIAVTPAGKIVWSLLPILSPGRTMLLFTPPRLPRQTPPGAARALTQAVCDHWRRRDQHLAQFLLDPRDQGVRDLYVSCGFEVLAELVYLQKPVSGSLPAADLPAGYDLAAYGPDTHGQFVRAIQGSYEGSLDCPALNGRRKMDDVIAGHKATGVFDPTMWFVAREQGEPRGVLILSPAAHSDAVELVYLGLTVGARGRGLGDALMRLALATTAARGRTELSLAVDSSNAPALRLYFRHGMKRIGSRIALIRELGRTEESGRPQPSPAAS